MDPTNEIRHRKESDSWVATARIWLCNLGACVSFLGVLLASYQNWVETAGVLVVAMVALLVIANLERFSEFKVLGASAKLKSTVEEASRILDSIRTLTAVAVRATVYAVSHVGRFHSGDEQQFEIIRQLTSLTRSTGFSETEREQLFQEWVSTKSFDFVQWILVNNSNLPSPLPDGYSAEVSKLNRDRTRMPPRPEELRAVLRQFQIKDQETEERVVDYEFFLTEAAIRRPRRWNSGRE